MPKKQTLKKVTKAKPDQNSSGAKPKAEKKPSMSLMTSFGLSLKNLFTKKGRTALTSFAGSIGIIGIALIMSLSNGIQNYIDKVQEDTLSSYPITIEAESLDMTGMMTSLMGVQAEALENRHEKDAVYSSTIMYDMMNSLISADKQVNNLTAFKEYLEREDSEIAQYVSSIQYSYDFDMNLYAQDSEGGIVKTDIVQLLEDTMSQVYGGDYSSFFATYGSMYAMANVWQEILPGEHGESVNPLLKEQYDLLYGKWPESYNEAILVVDKNNEVSDLVLYSLGLKPTGNIADEMEAFMAQETVHAEGESWSYEDVCSRSFRYIFPADQYRYDEEKEEYVNVAEEELGLKTLFNNGLEVKIVGVIRQNSDAVSGMMTGSVGYTHDLVEYIMAEAEKKDLVARQLAEPERDVFNGLPFIGDGDEAITNERKMQAARDYIAAADEEQLADVYIEFMCIPEESYLEEMLDEQLGDKDRQDLEDMILDFNPGYASLLEQMDDETLNEFMRQSVSETIKEQYAIQMKGLYSKLPDRELAHDFGLLALEDEDYLWIYDNAMPPVYSESSLKECLKKLGYADLDSPSTITIYASTFEAKDSIAEAIEHYNQTVSEEDEIQYTDMVAILMSSITTIINAISYVLIAFVAISLVVSSIMIGIITYISVLERTKEIGILRAIGASKKDVSRVFNAETFIIGLSAGLIGIGVTLLLNIPINIIVHDLTGIPSLNAELPMVGGAALVLISVLLTFVAGLIPSGLAAKKDPVEALRTE